MLLLLLLLSCCLVADACCCAAAVVWWRKHVQSKLTRALSTTCLIKRRTTIVIRRRHTAQRPCRVLYCVPQVTSPTSVLAVTTDVRQLTITPIILDLEATPTTHTREHHDDEEDGHQTKTISQFLRIAINLVLQCSNSDRTEIKTAARPAAPRAPVPPGPRGQPPLLESLLPPSP